jgi:hypothetical protein
MSEVRAHPRRGTRGVRRFWRRPPMDMTPRIELRLALHPDANYRERYWYEVSRKRGDTAQVSDEHPGVIYLFREPPPPTSIEEVLSHEELHRALRGIGEGKAYYDLDRVSNYKTARKHGTTGGF